MSSDKPKFNSKLLQDSFSNVIPDIDNHVQNLDAISADIKALEAYLEKSALHALVEFELQGDGVYRQWLCWAEDPKSERWRIMYKGAWNRRLWTCS